MAVPLTGTVVGTFLTTNRKGASVPLSGTVTFTPTPAVVLAPGQSATYLPAPVRVPLDATGSLFRDGSSGVVLVATNDASLNPVSWTYTVSFNLADPSGNVVPYVPFSITVPSGSTVDLAVVAPASPSIGVGFLDGGTAAVPVAAIRTRRATAALWTSGNPVLGLGERGFETDTGKAKTGDGATAWTSLAYEGIDDTRLAAAVGAGSTAAALNATYSLKLGWTIITGTGIDPTGVADSTSAIQAKLNATPFGGTAFLPAGYYKVGALTVPAGVTFKGAGWAQSVNALTSYGNAGYLSQSNLAGTVLFSTATSGTGLTATPANPMPIHLEDILIVGPGTGTSIGLAAGTATLALVSANWKRVGVMNFSQGVALSFVEDSTLGIIIRGCGSAGTFGSHTNNNEFTLLDIQRCGSGITEDSTCIANIFTNVIGQGNAGTTLVLGGVSSVLQGGYFENATSTWAVDITGTGNVVAYPQLTTAGDGIRIQSTANNTQILAPTASAAVAINNAGKGTFLSGDFLTNFTLTDTGTGTILSDTGNKMIKSENATVGGNAVNTPTLHINGIAGQPRNIFFETAGSMRWIVRAGSDAESGANAGSTLNIIPLSDTAGALLTADGQRSLQIDFRRADGRLTLPGPVVGGYSATASRPSPNTAGIAAQWYDSNLLKPLWSDGGNWRRADSYSKIGKTANYSILTTDIYDCYLFNGTSLTATLPDPTASAQDVRITVKNLAATALTVNSAGTSKTLDGAASQSLAQWAKATYVSDGTQWLTV